MYTIKTTTNSITGDLIQSKVASREYLDNFESIFGVKSAKTHSGGAEEGSRQAHQGTKEDDQEQEVQEDWYGPAGKKEG